MAQVGAFDMMSGRTPPSAAARGKVMKLDHRACLGVAWALCGLIGCQSSEGGVEVTALGSAARGPDEMPSPSDAPPVALEVSPPGASDMPPPVAGEPGTTEDGTSHDSQDAKKVLLGRRLFEDRNLSASGTQSCASCHDSARAFTGNNRGDDFLFPVATGAFEDQHGGRNAPSAMYMAFSPTFAFVAEQGEDAEAIEFTPTGGQFWDGRADDLAAQARGPFLNPREMALPNAGAVLERVQQADYAPLFREVFGADAFLDGAAAYVNLSEAIAAFESTDTFSPFSSKFDAVLRGTASFSSEEALGFSLFKDPEKGNCISCHVGDSESQDPHDWLFTDFTYDNLGVPRNSLIADNADVTHYDLGLCQQENLLSRVPPGVADPRAFVDSLCGAFKVPTLRNVGKTAPYMHNGYFTGLREVVEFYVTRETNPSKWYPSACDGTVQKYDDLPAEYHGNVNTEEVPYDRKLGEEPRLTASEIDAVVAFLRTLSDGYGEHGYLPETN
jgi:cytochrome c peroxidase